VTWITEFVFIFSFRFLKCYIGRPSQPIFVKLSSSSCLEPWTLERVPSLCQTRQGNSLRRGMEGTLGLRALSTPVKGRGLTVLFQVRGLWPAWEEKLFPLHKGSSLAVLCHHSWTGSKQFVWTTYTLYNQTGSYLAWLKPMQIQLYLFWIRQNVVFNYSSFKTVIWNIPDHSTENQCTGTFQNILTSVHHPGLLILSTKLLDGWNDE
jgi:hypothetical protein